MMYVCQPRCVSGYTLNKFTSFVTLEIYKHLKVIMHLFVQVNVLLYVRNVV
jgi:hypothetical protein